MMPRRRARRNRWEAAAFVLISKFSACVSAPPLEPKAILLSPVNAWYSYTALLMLCVVAVVAFMVIPGGSPAEGTRSSRARRRTKLVEGIARAEASFDPSTLDSVLSRPYEKAYANMLRLGIQATDMDSIKSLESECCLDEHTLIIFISWKKRQLDALPLEQTDAERKAAKRARDERAELEAAKQRDDEHHREQQLAAAAIKHTYTTDRDSMVFHAAQECLANGGAADLKASVNRVLAARDKWGNKAYHTLSKRTLFKHATCIAKNPAYRPKTKGGAPSVINNPLGDDFVRYLKAEYHKENRTAQNSKSMKDMDRFIIDRYKLMFYKNADAAAPDFSKGTLRELRKRMKLKVGAAKSVSARRWQAMGDPRNYMSFYVTCNVALKDVPLELRFNWDDTSLFVAGEQRGAGGCCLGVAFTAEEVERELAALNRSPGMQAPTVDGPQCTPRMVCFDA
jgi:hypothetical protein